MLRFMGWQRVDSLEKTLMLEGLGAAQAEVTLPSVQADVKPSEVRVELPSAELAKETNWPISSVLQRPGGGETRPCRPGKPEVNWSGLR